MKVKEAKHVYMLKTEAVNRLRELLAEGCMTDAVITLEDQMDKGDMPHISVGGEVIVFSESDFEKVVIL